MTNKIAFTICSNNYLSQAKVLVDSLLEHNPDYQFIIGLCDRKNSLIDYSLFSNCTIVEVEELHIPNFENMCLEYDIIELNTSIKPFYFSYIFETLGADLVYYIDPDICIYNSFSIIEKEMNEIDILLTPHIYTPIPLDGHKPQENVFLNYGIYNLGFLALKKSAIVFDLLKWWSLKLETNCYNNVLDGHFVDQLPMNYVPIFFDKVLVSKNVGLNVAYWNFHERVISEYNGKYKINDKINLVFFHFSNFKAANKDEITPLFTRFQMNENPVIAKLYSTYYDKLILNRYFENEKLSCYFVDERASYLAKKRIETLRSEPFDIKILRAVKLRIPKKINRFLLKYSHL